MEGVVNSPRPYRSARREAQASETRTRIVRSARDLFLEKGFPATTIAAIARHAEVAADTVYASFGSKAALLKAVLDVAIGGDEQDLKMLDRQGPVDAAAAELRADLQLRQRQMAMRMTAGWISAHGPLRIPDEEAAAVLWTLTSPEVHQMMRDVWGWSRERFVEWLQDSLTHALLPHASGPHA